MNRFDIYLKLLHKNQFQNNFQVDLIQEYNQDHLKLRPTRINTPLEGNALEEG
jgi:hypothetical protein